MTDISIYLPDGSVINAPVTESAKWNQDLMKEDSIQLSWNTGESVKIPMGSYIINPITGSRYYIMEHYYPQARNNAEYQYQPTFAHELFMMSKIPFLLYTAEGVESDWNYTGRGSDLALTLERSILNAINQRYSVVIEDDIEASLSLQFSNVDIITALNNIAAAWDCEWWTDQMIDRYTEGKVIHFGKMCLHTAGEATGYDLIAGDNIETPNSNQKATYFNRFYVFGGTRNIPQDYQGAQANHVVNKRLTLDPDKFPQGYIDLPVFTDDGEATWDATSGKYVTEVTDEEVKFTKVLYLDDVYPKSNCRIKYGSLQTCRQYVTDSNTGKPVQLASGEYDTWYKYVFRLEYQKADGTWEDFANIFNTKTYDKTKNPTGNLIKGLALSVHFNSGALEGREFEVNFRDHKETIYGAETSDNIEAESGTFEIVHKEDNTIIIPNTGIAPKAGTSAAAHDGDKVIVFNCRMPNAYYDTAYLELEDKAIKEIYELTKDSNQYVVKSNPVAFANNQPFLTIGRRISLHVGGRSIDTRITKLSVNLDRNFEQEITLSKSISKGTINTLVTTIASTEQKVVNVSVEDTTQRKITKQQFFNSLKEMKDSMFDTDGYFTAPISPVTIDTMMLSVGATSQNFQLENVLFRPNYFPNTSTESFYNRFYVESNNGKLVHYGIELDSAEPRQWNMAGGETEWYNDGVITSTPTNASAYYLYAQCSITGEGGIFILDTKQRKYNSDSQFYYFLVGVLSSATTQNNYTSRILNTTYGATTINGNNIKTGRIQSTDGETYFDLDRGEIGGKIMFKSGGTEQDLNSYVTQLVGEVASEEVDKAIGGDIDTKINTAVDEKLNDLSIDVGGRNYIQQSKGWLYATNMGKTGLDNSLCFRSTDASFCTQYVDNQTIMPYETPICLSMYMRAEKARPNNQIRVCVRCITPQSSNAYNISVYSPVGTSWQRVVITGKIGVANVNRLQVFIKQDVVDGWVDFCMVKLESSSMPSDWTIAPEELDANISNAQTTANNALKTANNIQIGGRNYIREASWSSASSLGTIGVDNRLAWRYTNNNVFCYQTLKHNEIITKGAILTLSCYVRSNKIISQNTLRIGIRHQNSSSDNLSNITLYPTIDITNTWIRYTITGEVTASNATQLIMYFKLDGVTANIDFCQVKLEVGNKATSWTPAEEDTEEEIEAARQRAIEAETNAKNWNSYLNNAIKGTTQIAGGLMLSNVLGLGNITASADGKGATINTLTTGMNGVSARASENVLRIWAGSTGKTFAEAATAPFRVYDDGSVFMGNMESYNSSETTAKVRIDNGQIILERGGNVLTQIMPVMGNSVNGALSLLNLGTKSFTSTAFSNQTAKQDKLTLNGTNIPSSQTKSFGGSITSSRKTLFTAESSGYLDFTSDVSVSLSSMGSVSFSNSGTQGVLIYDNSYTHQAMFMLTIYADGVVKKSFSTALTSSGSATLSLKSSGQDIFISKGSVVTYEFSLAHRGAVTTSVRATTGSPYGYTNEVTTGDIVGSMGAFSVSIDYENYNNRYIADGFVISSANNNYMTYVPTEGVTGEVWRLRQDSLILRLKNKVLSMTRGSSYYYNANPLVFVGRYTMSNSQISGRTALYNPLGLGLSNGTTTEANKLKDSRTSTGCITFYHQLAQSTDKYSVTITPYGSTRIAQVMSLAAKTFQIRFDNSNGAAIDPSQFDIMIYDCSTYA